MPNPPTPPTIPQASDAPRINPAFLVRMLLGGAALGGGAGMLTSLLHQRNAIVEDNEEPEAGLELQLPPRHPKMASHGFSSLADGLASVGDGVNWLASKATGGYLGEKLKAPNEQPLSGWDYALGGAAFPLAALGGLHVARKAYQGWREQDLKARLKEQQSQYMQALQEEAASAGVGHHKHANTQPDDARRALSIPQWAMMTIGGIPILTALTSGMLTDRFLTQQFPTKPKVKPPTGDVRLSTMTDPADEEDEILKRANDMLVHTALQFGKLAGDAGVTSVVAAVAGGLLEDLEEQQFKYGSDAMFDLAQGSGHTLPEDPLIKCAAIRAAVRSGIGDSLMVMASGVFANAAPTWHKQGAEINKSSRLANQMLHGSTAMLNLHIAALAGEDTVKEAAQLPAGKDPLTQLREMLRRGTQHKKPVATSTLQTGAAGSQFSAMHERAEPHSSAPPDNIDGILTRGK